MISKREQVFIHKTAWTWSDVGSEVASFLVADVGIMGALGYAGIASGGATGGAGAMAAIAGGPIGWAILGLGLAGGIAYAVLSKTDDNIDDLLARMDALDYEGTEAEPDIKKWDQDLRALKGQINVPVTSADPQEQAFAMGNKLAAVAETVKYMEMMQKMFPQAVEPHLKDWGFDPGDFTYALNRTVQTLKAQMAKLDAAAKQEAEKIIKKNPKVYTALATEVVNLKNQITEAWATPTFTPEEQKVMDIAQKAINNQANVYELNTSREAMVKLKNDMNKLLQEAKRRASKRAGEDERPISKRAVSLPDEPTANVPAARPEQMKGERPGTQKKRKRRRGGIPKMPVVGNLQRYLNHLREAAKITEAPYLSEDDRYGPNTAKALLAVLKKFPRTAEYLRMMGVPMAKIGDYRFMNSNDGVRFINLTAAVLRKFTQYYTNQGEQKEPWREISQRDKNPAGPQPPEPPPPPPLYPGSPGSQVTQQQPGTQQVHKLGPRSVLDKRGPTPQDVVNALQTTYGYKGNTRVNLYDYMRNRGMTDDNMVIMINELFPGAAPRTWSPEMIIRAVGSRYGG